MPADTPVTAEPKRGLAPKRKKGSAEDVAFAFARGDINLATALGVTTTQRKTLKDRAFTFLKDKQPALAKPLLEGLVALDPYDLWPLTALASINLDSKNLPLALTLLNRAVDVANTDVTARALRAEVRHHLGDHEGALADLSFLLENEMAPAAQRARAVVVGDVAAETASKARR